MWRPCVPAGRVGNDDRLTRALAAILDDTTLEPAFVALALMLPGEGDIAREIGQDIDPDAIFRARAALKAEIGERLGPTLTAAYDRMTVPGPYSPDAHSAGRRALRNVALDLLAARAEPTAIARAARQYKAADNMTDRMAALATLSLHDVPERKAALADFYARYASDALVVDKWFSLQAMIPQPDTLDKVRALTSPPCLLDGQSQPRAGADRGLRTGQCHPIQPAGRCGLRIRCRYVLTLDPKNPQISARLATAFRTWRTLESTAGAPRPKPPSSASREHPIFLVIWPTLSNAPLPPPEWYRRRQFMLPKLSVGNIF